VIEKAIGHPDMRKFGASVARRRAGRTRRDVRSHRASASWSLRASTWPDHRKSARAEAPKSSAGHRQSAHHEEDGEHVPDTRLCAVTFSSTSARMSSSQLRFDGQLLERMQSGCLKVAATGCKVEALLRRRRIRRAATAAFHSSKGPRRQCAVVADRAGEHHPLESSTQRANHQSCSSASGSRSDWSTRCQKDVLPLPVKRRQSTAIPGSHFRASRPAPLSARRAPALRGSTSISTAWALQRSLSMV